MSHLIEKTPGIFDPSRRFAFTNITDTDFTSYWGGSPITVKSGQTVELSHHLANKMTDEMVDLIMIGKTKAEEVEAKERLKDPFWRSPTAGQLGVPAARKVWADQIVRELALDEESPEIQQMRATMREELLRDMSQDDAGPVEDISIPASATEFAGLSAAAPEKVKAPIRVKTIAKPENAPEEAS